MIGSILFYQIINLVKSKEALGCEPADIKWTEIANEVAGLLKSGTARKGTNVRDWVDDTKKALKSGQSLYSTTEGCLVHPTDTSDQPDFDSKQQAAAAERTFGWLLFVASAFFCRRFFFVLSFF